MPTITERDVEAKFIQPLFHNILGYPDDLLHWNHPVKITLGRQSFTKLADLVVFFNGKPVIVVEAKKPTEILSAYIDQVDSYAFNLQTPYSIITNGKSFILRGYYSFNSRINIIETNVDELESNNWEQIRKLISYFDIASSQSLEPNKVVQPNKEKIKDFRRFFRSVHSIIRDREKLDPATSFDELSKVLFLKASEEEWLRTKGGNSFLTIDKILEFENIRQGQGLDYVNRWFVDTTQEFFPDVFEPNTQINFKKTETLIDLLSRMENFHVKNGDVDVKGRAFEEFLPTQLRGKGLGQYFTPRPIVNFMVDLAEISIYDTVVDFSCGSGGFLIKAYERMQNLVEQLPDGTWQRLGLNKEDFIEDIKSRQIHGIDAEPRAARTAKMNMLMWGDGKCIARGNALDYKDSNNANYIPPEYIPEIKNSGCSIILANPPFGSKEKDQDILGRYILGSKNALREKQKTEILFLEKGIKLLRPEGKMLIVLPIGILSNESYQYVRDYIHSEAEIRGIFALPTHTFVQSGVDTIKTCVLYLQKFTKEKKELYDKKTLGLSVEEKQNLLRTDADFDYTIFMGIAEFVGFEPSGRPNVLPNEQTDLDLLLKDFRNQSNLKMPELNVIEFASQHYEEKNSMRVEGTVRGTNKNLKTSFTVSFSKLESRLDPSYFLFQEKAEPLIKDFETLEGKIEQVSNTFRPTTEEEKDAEYAILSVTNNEGVVFNEHRKGEEFTQGYKKVHTGDIVFNPYRVNVGSIGIVPKDLDGGYVSPAYVVFRSLEYKPEFLIELLKSPFYKMYIDIFSTGSIRDSLSYDSLSKIKVPKVDESKQEIINNLISQTKKQISGLSGEIGEKKEKIVSELHSLIKP